MTRDSLDKISAKFSLPATAKQPPEPQNLWQDIRVRKSDHGGPLIERPAATAVAAALSSRPNPEYRLSRRPLFPGAAVRRRSHRPDRHTNSKLPGHQQHGTKLCTIWPPNRHPSPTAASRRGTHATVAASLMTSRSESPSHSFTDTSAMIPQRHRHCKLYPIWGWGGRSILQPSSPN